MKQSIANKRAPLFPMPVLLVATYNEDGTPDIMNMAWGGITNAGRITLNMNRQHQTAHNICQRRAFTVSPATTETIAAADFVGLVSARDDGQKVAKSGFRVAKAETVDAPVIEQCPTAIVCVVEDLIEEGHVLHVTGRIVDCLAETSVLNAEGEVDASLVKGVVFDTFGKAYYAIGEKIADAWSVGSSLKEDLHI